MTGSTRPCQQNVCCRVGQKAGGEERRADARRPGAVYSRPKAARPLLTVSLRLPELSTTFQPTAPTS